MRTIEVTQPEAGSTNGTPDNGGTPRPRVTGGGRDSVMVVLFALVAVALIASLVGVGLGVRAVDESKDNGTTKAAAEGATGAPATADVTLSDLAIAPKAIEVATGGSLQIANKGAIQHNLAVEGTGLKTAMIDGGGKATLDVSSLAAGSYAVFCEVSGHREAGMAATLKITAGAAGTGTHAATGGSGSAAAPMTADEMDATMAARTKAFPAKTEGKGAQDLAPTVLSDGTKQFDVTAKVIQWEVEPGRKVDAWAYNGTVPGPTIRVNPGDKVKVVLRNELPESTVLHFHGIETPNAVDGVPDVTQAPVKPGASYTYAFTAQSTPAVGMYHSHHDAQKQVGMALAGAFLIGSQPVPAGVQVAQEKVMMLNDTGTIGYSLNGKSFPATEPYVAKQGEWLEVHYMNEGVTIHPMHLHGLAQTVIAKDGFAVPQPYQADTILVGPGERYTVLVHATTPGTWAWHCHILPHAEREDGMFGMVTALVVS